MTASPFGRSSIEAAGIATTAPAEKFKLDAVGRAAPHGNTVTNPESDGDTATTFKNTDPASTATPPRPPTTT